MRQITKESVKAFKNWERFSLSNTIVKVFEWISQMFLHWNEIARFDWHQLYLDTCGWKTNTTKERMNWILEELGLWRIRQVDWVWFYKDKDWHIEEFNRKLLIQL